MFRATTKTVPIFNLGANWKSDLDLAIAAHTGAPLFLRWDFAGNAIHLLGQVPELPPVELYSSTPSATTLILQYS